MSLCFFQFAAVVYRRGRYTVKPRTIYANRIAYLIATKRNTLKRLALKGAAHRLMYRTTKRVGRKTTMRMTRSGTGKRAGRSNAVSRHDSLILFMHYLCCYLKIRSHIIIVILIDIFDCYHHKYQLQIRVSYGL